MDNRGTKAAKKPLGAESSPPVLDSSAGGDVGDKAESTADASKMPPPPVITRHAACQLIFFLFKSLQFLADRT